MNEIGRLELIRESLIAVVNEMRANVIRSSYSSIIYEGHDFSCALTTADGRLVAQARQIIRFTSLRFLIQPWSW